MKIPKFNAIIKYLEGDKSMGSTYNASRDAKLYILPHNEGKNDIPHLIDIKSRAKVYDDESLKNIIMKTHSENGHLSFIPLHSMLRNDLGIVASRRFTQKCVTTCRTCKMTSCTNVIIPLPVENGIFERVQVDLIELSTQPSSLGHRYIMTVLDCFSKYIWTYPLESKESVMTTFYIDLWIKEHGVPKIFQSDNGREFKNEDLNCLFEEMEMTVVHGRERHPGKVEAVNKSLKSILRKLVLDSKEEWIYLLSDATAYYNNRMNYSIGMTPYEALYGRKKRTKADDSEPRRNRKRAEPERSDEVMREERNKTLRKIRRSVQENLEKSRENMIKEKNIHIPKLFRGQTVAQYVPHYDRGQALGLNYITALVYEVLKNDTYRLMYKDGSLSQRAAHIGTLDVVPDEQWRVDWFTLADVRQTTRKPVRKAVRLYL